MHSHLRSVLISSFTLGLACSLSAQGVPEGPEPNNSAATATQFDCGLHAYGDISYQGDRDYFEFSLSQTREVTIFTGPGDSPADSKIALELWDGAGAPVAGVLSRRSGYERIDSRLTAGLYHIVVACNDLSNPTGHYTLDLRCSTSSGTSTKATHRIIPGGCAGTNGTAPTLAAPALEWPLLGTTFLVNVDNMPPNTLLFTILGHQNHRTLGGTPLPLDLGPFGAPGCWIETDTLFVKLQAADSAGSYDWYIPIPNELRLLNLPITQQALVVDLGANALGLTTSNSAVGRVGDRL